MAGLINSVRPVGLPCRPLKLRLEEDAQISMQRELIRGADGAPCDIDLSLDGDTSLGAEGYELASGDGRTRVRAAQPHGLLYGMFHLLRLDDAPACVTVRPAVPRRMLDHWDNVDVHPVMGQVERGYAGGSLFWRAGTPRRDLDRVTAYASAA